MICQKCGMHDRVTRTVREDGKIIRYRRCVKCGDVVQTEETVVDEKPRRKKPSKPKPAPRKPAETEKPKGALEMALEEAK